MQALREAGLEPDPQLIFQGRFDEPSGHECATELFSRARERWPSAIFASNDQMAYGVLHVAEQRGVRVPEEVALIGFDDNQLSVHMRPPLTTIRQPFFEMGYKAIEWLLTMVDPDHRSLADQAIHPVLEVEGVPANLADPQLKRLQLSTSLVIRASSGGTYHAR